MELAVPELNMCAKVGTERDCRGAAHQSQAAQRAKIPQLLLQCAAKRCRHAPTIQVRWAFPQIHFQIVKLQISFLGQSF